MKDCSQECQRDSTCNSFSYRSVSTSTTMNMIIMSSSHSRYSGVTSNTGDNCLLSADDVARLVNNNDVLVDDNWDLYQRVEGGYNCRGAQTGEEMP